MAFLTGASALSRQLFAGSQAEDVLFATIDAIVPR